MSSDVLDGLSFERAVARYGQWLLTIGFGLAVAVVIAAAWITPHLVPFLPVAIGGMTAAWFVFRRPTLNLCLVLALFPLVADFEEGIEVKEILYGLYLASFLAHWHFRRIFLERRKLLETTDDYLMAAILWMVALYLPVSIVFGAEAGVVRSEFIPFTALAVYFPAKAAVQNSSRGTFMIFVALLCIGLFVTLRNFLWMQELISEATMAWQITQKGRIVSNEILLVVPAMAMLAWGIQLKGWRTKGIVLLSFLAMALALVITQSRGFWVAFALGCLIMLIGLTRRERTELIVISLAALAISALLLVLFFKDTALLLFAGMFNRFLSLGTAVTEDISLINRFLESRAVWDRIVDNPILGYGFGVPYQYFNITITGTRDWSFIHNGYLALWYRFGIFGATLICVLWARSIYHSGKLARNQAERWYKIPALTSLAVLSSMLLSNLTSNGFFHIDSLLMFGLLTGMTAGIRQKSQSPDPTSSP